MEIKQRCGPMFDLMVRYFDIEACWVREQRNNTEYEYVLHVGRSIICRLTTKAGSKVVTKGQFFCLVEDMSDYKDDDELSLIGLTLATAKRRIVSFAADEMRDLLGVAP